MAKILHKANLAKDPMIQFDRWFTEAISSGLVEPSAMNLSTATREGKPSSRIVLLKDYSDKGFCFYTNYNSNKGRVLNENPCAALTFYWPGLNRQIRIEGEVSKVPFKESDNYFSSRHRGSQIGASVSPQSAVIPSRKFLDKEFSEFEKKMLNRKITRPEHWGGFRLKPYRVEFWQGQENRMHDRFLYSLTSDQWEITRLAP